MNPRSGEMSFDGERVGSVVMPTTIGGNDWRAKAYARTATTELGVFATEQEAKDALTAHWNARAATAAQSIERWKPDAYKAAVARGDGTAMRRMTRGLLYQNGVLPRDALFGEEPDTLTVMTRASMPDALAVHRWNGAVGVRQDVMAQVRTDFKDHLSTVVHEELHGSTNFGSSGFYSSYGAAIEEVSVEMASRKIAAKATKTPPQWYGGSYQSEIEEVVTIVQEEVARVRGSHRGAKDREAIADAGIAMRGRKAKGRAAHYPSDILDQFMANLKVPAKAKKLIRKRIVDNVRAPR